MKVVNLSNHPIDLADGRVLAPNEGATVDSNRHNRALVDRGAVRVIESKPPKTEKETK